MIPHTSAQVAVEAGVPFHPEDELVELIAFAQTRAHVKRVVGIYARYRLLYGPAPDELPLAVDTTVAKAGPVATTILWYPAVPAGDTAVSLK